MSQIYKVPNPLTDEQLATIEAHFAGIRNILDAAAISTTASQRRSMIKVSTMRVDLIKDVDIDIISAYPEVVPSFISISNYRNNMVYAQSLKGLMGKINAITSGVFSLLRITNNNQMSETTMILDSARLAADHNTGMSKAMNKLAAKHFKSQPGKNKPTSFTTPVGVKATLSGLIPKKVFTNMGTSILSLLNVDGNIADTLLVYPFTGVKIPKGWINVVVTNLSQTSEASYRAFLKN